MKLPAATQIPRPGIGKPYRLDVPFRWTLHTIECPPELDPTNIARTHENPPHFWVCLPKRIIVQTVDTDLAARALAHPAGSVETNHARAVQVEIAGRAGDTDTYPAEWWTWLRDALLAPVAKVHGIDLRIQPPLWAEADRAYGTGSETRMTDAEWLGFRGVCGHQHVPANSHWDPGAVPAHLLKPAGVPAPEPEELTVADVAKIMAKLDKIDTELDAVRAGTVAAGAKVADVVVSAVEGARDVTVEALNGTGALVRRGPVLWLLHGGRRVDVSGLSKAQAIELKGHLGIERDSAEASDAVWSVIEAVTSLA